MSLFESTHPYLVQREGIVLEKTGHEKYTGLFITIQLKNKGKRAANKTRVLLTEVCQKGQDGIWKPVEKRWTALPLQWDIPIYTTEPEREVGRDMVPNVPLDFNLASFDLEKRKNQLLLTVMVQ